MSTSTPLVSTLLFLCMLPACSSREKPLPFSQREMPVRLLRYRLDVAIDFSREQMRGRAQMVVRNSGRSRVGSIPLLLYRLLRVTSIQGEGLAPMPFEQRILAFEDFDRLQVNYLEVDLPNPIEPGMDTSLTIEYEGYLLGAAESGMRYVKDHIDREFTILRSDAFAFPCLGFPSFFALRAAGLPTFDWEAQITVPEDLVVANGGQLVDRRVHDGQATYSYNSIKPSWRMDFAIGTFDSVESDGLRVFYFPQDREGAVAGARAFRRAFETLSQWFGPLHGSQNFAILEVPEGYGGQADVTCILQTADAFRDPERAFLIYHEVTHLWNVPPTDLPSPRLEEGLAVFLQWLLTDDFAEVHGELLEARLSAIADRLRNRFATQPAAADVPPIDYGRKEMTDLSYQVGALMFAIVHELVGAEEFNEMIGGFYQANWNSGASIDDFTAFAKAHTRVDLAWVFKDWIYTTAFVEMLRSKRSVKSIAEAYRQGRP